MGLKVTTDDRGIKVIRKDNVSKNGVPYTQYSLMYSSKDKSGNWQNGFIDAQFKKDTDIPNKSIININNAFPILDEYNGNKRNKIFVLDWEMVTPGEAPNNNNDFMQIPDEDAEEMELIFNN